MHNLSREMVANGMKWTWPGSPEAGSTAEGADWGEGHAPSAWERSGDSPVVGGLESYRGAVAELSRELSTRRLASGRADLENVLRRRLAETVFADLLRQVPGGADAAVAALSAEVARFRPARPSAAGDLVDLIRIFLLSQIDAVWWGQTAAYRTDADVLASNELIDLDDRELDVRYRRQTDALARRAVRACVRSIAPHRSPHTAGLRFTQARPEVVALLELLAADFARRAPRGTPPLWITSLTRSLQHQDRLRALGYPAMLPSSHCTGHAVDLAMSFYRRYGAARPLQQLLWERQERGDLNVIDEGDSWHICLSPTAISSLRHHFTTRTGA